MLSATAQSQLCRLRPVPALKPRPLTAAAASSSPLADQSPPSTSPPPPPRPSPPRSQILTLRRSLLARETTAVQLAESYLARLRLVEPRLNSFLHVSDSVLREAQSVDDRIGRGEDVGPLAGVLVGVKDNICTADMPSTGGSRILEDYRPPFDATAVRKVRELGGIVVGKTNLDEFGMGSTTEGSAYKVCTCGILSFGLSQVLLDETKATLNRFRMKPLGIRGWFDKEAIS